MFVALRFLACFILAALTLGAVAPAASPPLPLMASGVTIYGEKVGGMTSERARRVIERSFERPLRLGYYKKRWRLTPARLGAQADIGGAVTRALDARAGQAVRLDVTVPARALREYVGTLDKRYSRPVVDARLDGLSLDLQPVITEERPGIAVKRAFLGSAIRRALRWGDRSLIPLRMRPIQPTVRSEDFHSIIVIRRGSNQLYLYDGASLTRTFRVATGTAKYPTPLGQWSIVDMQRDPWWIPPPDSDWSKDLKPIPPGPGNPLGTRWMGLSAPAVGIHGTPDAKSIGYSASHGCIRMHISEADWLFDHVDIGTPVFIV